MNLPPSDVAKKVNSYATKVTSELEVAKSFDRLLSIIS